MAKLSELRMYILKNGRTKPYTVNPYALIDGDLSDFYREGKSRFKCSCGLLYELRHGDNALIPVSRKSVFLHKDTCPLSDRYRHKENALLFDPKEGRPAAFLSGDISRRPVRSPSSGSVPEKTMDSPPLSLSPYGLIKRLNLLALYYEYEKKRAAIESGNFTDYPKYYLLDRFSRLVYSSARTVGILGQNKTVCGSGLEKDGYGFFYRPVRALEIKYRDGYRRTALFEHVFSPDDLYSIARAAGIEDPVHRNSDTGALFIRLLFNKDAPPLRVSFPALKEALRHLNMSADHVDFFPGDVIAAGWRYPDLDREGAVKRSSAGNIYSVAERLSLLRANRYGIFTESGDEYRLSEHIIKMVNTSPYLLYYKPFILTDEFYQGKWLPKGVIRAVNINKDIVLETAASTRSNEFMDKERRQEKDKHIYLTWITEKEPLNDFMERISGAVTPGGNGG